MSLMFEPLRRFAQFDGRSRRAEYWLFLLFTILADIVALLLGGLFDNPPSPDAQPEMIAYAILSLALLLPSLGVAVRRLHDTNRSGWWYLLIFLPIIGGIIILIFMLTPGVRGPNRYGPDPKAKLAEVFV